MDYEYDKRMGQQIKKMREQHDLTQDQLSAKMQTEGCDITRSGLAKIEVGQRHIYAIEIRAFHKVLKVPYDELFV